MSPMSSTTTDDPRQPSLLSNARRLEEGLRPRSAGLYRPEDEHDACGIGFIAQLEARAQHQIVADAAEMLIRMDHRGACGCDPNSGDGAGMLVATPVEFLRTIARERFDVELPEAGLFAAGNVFLPRNEQEAATCREVVEEVVRERGQQVIGWRPVPTDAGAAQISGEALAAMPTIEMLFVAAGPETRGELDAEAAFERQLFLVRKIATQRLRGTQEAPSQLREAERFYICTLSPRTLVYKGMLTPEQVPAFYSDLLDPRFATHLAMVHSRFSTNTFPSWDRAQPNRVMSHNGEINTLRGNRNWMRARQGLLESELFGDDLESCFPIAEEDCSDSGNFDNVLEFLMLGGRPLHEAVMMMIPEAWQNHEQMSPERRAFYEAHSALMEPWDGPASIAFTDGRFVGAVLDRNGLRPSRYWITDDHRVIMASEVGVVTVPAAKVIRKGRLQPGRMFLVDFQRGRVVDDVELKETIARQKPYGEWLERQRFALEDLEPGYETPGLDADTIFQRQQAFGYSSETLHFMLQPLVEQQRDPLGSMGNDAALACLSEQPHLIYDYFKQLFAQVTNPPIDAIREEVILSLECLIGPEGNLLDMSEQHCQRLRLPSPLLGNAELQRILALDGDPDIAHGWSTRCIDITWGREHGGPGLQQALDRICSEAEQAIDEGRQLIVLSDRAACHERVPVPSLLAVGAVHHHLVAAGKRTRAGLIVESGEAREVHHHCLLVGYGADAINPYLAYESLWHAQAEGRFGTVWPADEIVRRYRKGVRKGMLKVMGKMGISTLQSYKGAQIFEAVGLHSEVIERCFVGTASRLQGVGFDQLAAEVVARHAAGFPDLPERRQNTLPNVGEFHWRASGQQHMWSPPAIASLQAAARSGDENAYWQFADYANEQATRRCTLRGLLDFKTAAEPIPLDEVEPASEIVRRFCTGAMSFGSISKESHETLAIAMNRLGGKSNTGEGGEDPERFKILPNGDSKRSAIKQIASGRFGVTSWYLTNADELQIKMAQGAKPGEGGELPGHKVDEVIARTRHSTPGVGLISPPPHHDIYSIEDLAQLIYDLKNANPEARISVKLVSEVGVGTVAAGVSKAKAEHILISGHDGGTGASPLTSIKHAGLPWELGLAETHQTLVLNDLRSRVVLQTDGQLKTGRDVVVGALLGAEEFGFSTAPLIAMGCIMMRKCHLNTCPVGIATQDPELRKKFQGKAEHVVNYLFMVAEEARRILAQLGARTLTEVVGRTDLLETREAVEHWQRHGLDLTAILTPAERPRDDVDVVCTQGQDHGLADVLDRQLIKLAAPALGRDGAIMVRERLRIRNTDRTVGTLLTHRVMKECGEAALPEDTVHFRFAGSAGQSFGAFLCQGLTLELIGDANDYVGKGLSGGRLIVRPPFESPFDPSRNVVAGNVCLYGATSGEAFFRGVVAERFCVRNSGARTVVEGVGDHGCEYMTGGRTVVLGSTGRNFAAGMSGGIAWVWDPDQKFEARCNLGMVALEQVTEEFEDELRDLIVRHAQTTGSDVAARLLQNWNVARGQFVQVMPRDYRRVLDDEARILEHDDDVDNNADPDDVVAA